MLQWVRYHGGIGNAALKALAQIWATTAKTARRIKSPSYDGGNGTRDWRWNRDCWRARTPTPEVPGGRPR